MLRNGCLREKPCMAAFEAYRRVAVATCDALTAGAVVKMEVKPGKRSRLGTLPIAPAAPPLYMPEPPGLTPPPALLSLPQPFVAPRGQGLWRERYTACCAACFVHAAVCHHHVEVPLRCLLIGHNPSTHAWASGYPFSNPSNRFYKLLREAGILAQHIRPCDADAVPALFGLGWTDAGCVPGSDASEYKRAVMLAWRDDLYSRLKAHLARIAAWTGHECDDEAIAPRVVAFAGKRQWASLFQPPLAGGFNHGVQDVRPPGWPLPASTEVWVLPSSSGRAVMTAEQRQGPYMELGRRLADLPWPRTHH